MFAHLNPHSSYFGDICALYSPFLHQLTVQSSLFQPGCLRPCPSYSSRRDRINLGLLRSLYRWRGGVARTVHVLSAAQTVNAEPGMTSKLQSIFLGVLESPGTRSWVLGGGLLCTGYRRFFSHLAKALSTDSSSKGEGRVTIFLLRPNTLLPKMRFSISCLPGCGAPGCQARKWSAHGNLSRYAKGRGWKQGCSAPLPQTVVFSLTDLRLPLCSPWMLTGGSYGCCSPKSFW